MNPRILFDSEDGDADAGTEAGERKRSVVISMSWDTGVSELLMLTMVAHPNTGCGAVLQRLSANDESARIVVNEDGIEAIAEELTRWVRRHRASASGHGT